MKYIIFVWLNQNTEIMNTTIFTAEIDSAEMPKISAILKELKGKFIKIEEKEFSIEEFISEKQNQEITEFSKSINKKGAKKWFDKKNIAV